MSKVRAEQYTNRLGTGAPEIPYGVTVPSGASIDGAGGLNLTGIATAGTFKGDLSGNVTGVAATFTGPVTIGGTLTYEDVTNIDSVGVITARSGVKINVGGVNIAGGGINAVGVVTAINDIKANGNIIGDNSTNISGVSSVTATTYYGSGASLTGIDAAPQIKVNASGSISAGNAVVANTDGTVSKIGLSYTAVDPYTVYGCPTEQYWNGNASPQFSDCLTCQIQDNYMLVGRKNESNSNTIQISWLNVPDTGDASTWSSIVSITGSNGTLLDMHHDPTRNQAVVVYKKNDDRVYFRTVRVQSNNISTGSEHQLNTTAAYADVKLSYDTAANKFLIVYGKDPTQSNYCTAQVMTVVDNDTFTFGSLVTIKANQCAHIDADFDTSAGKHLVLYRDNGISDDCYGIVATVSGTSVTFGTAVELETGNNEGAKIKYSTTDSKFLWLSLNMTGGEVDVSVLTISGTSVSRGTNTTITTTTAGNSSGTIALSYEDNLDVFYILYRNNYVGKKRTATISGTNVTVGSEANSRCGPNSVADCDIDFDKGSGRTLLVMQNGGSNAGLYQVWTTSSSATNVTAENYIGVSAGNYTNGQEATIKLCGNTDSNQVGLTTGQNYFAQNDGTISLTADSPQVFVGNAVSATKLALASPAAIPAPTGWELIKGGTHTYAAENEDVILDNMDTTYAAYDWWKFLCVHQANTSNHQADYELGIQMKQNGSWQTNSYLYQHHTGSNGSDRTAARGGNNNSVRFSWMSGANYNTEAVLYGAQNNTIPKFWRVNIVGFRNNWTSGQDMNVTDLLSGRNDTNVIQGFRWKMYGGGYTGIMYWQLFGMKKGTLVTNGA